MRFLKAKTDRQEIFYSLSNNLSIVENFVNVDDFFKIEVVVVDCA